MAGKRKRKQNPGRATHSQPAPSPGVRNAPSQSRPASGDDDALHLLDVRSEDEIDRMARSGGRTEWQEPTAPAAGDPLTEDELRGLDLLGRSSVRDGAIEGVSGMAGSGGDSPYVRPASSAGEDVPRGPRRNPPESDDAALANGGISDEEI